MMLLVDASQHGPTNSMSLSSLRGLTVRVPECQNYKWRLNPIWHRMLYCCTHVATVGVRALNDDGDWECGVCQLLEPLDAAEAMDHICRALKHDEVNWKSLLSLTAVTLVTCTDAAQRVQRKRKTWTFCFISAMILSSLFDGKKTIWQANKLVSKWGYF